ncbi:hypothetical protein [Streptomyces sp. MH60]|nr:hypothetical protein [Streptomyces sp. MH60]
MVVKAEKPDEGAAPEDFAATQLSHIRPRGASRRRRLGPALGWRPAG